LPSDLGFTLIEMVVVLLIIGLAALVGPAIVGQTEESKRKTAKVQVKGFAQSVRMFALDTRAGLQLIEWTKVRRSKAAHG
jgi:prepilin-type N-terminal cleavage/methylation domain-containing protein